MTSKDIQEVFRQHYKYRFNYTGLFEFEITENYTSCRFDAIIIHAHRQYIQGFEFKVSRIDFLNDLHNGKWKKYLQYCHSFLWACPESLIQPEEIELPAGLMWICPNEKTDDHYLKIIKKPKRIIPSPDIELLQKILFLFASRAKNRSGDYF